MSPRSLFRSAGEALAFPDPGELVDTTEILTGNPAALGELAITGATYAQQTQSPTKAEAYVAVRDLCLQRASEAALEHNIAGQQG